MTKKEIEIRGTPGLTPPMFSDGVHVSVNVRQGKAVKGKAERTGHLRLTFLDTYRKQVLAEIVIDHMHAKDLARVITANVKALDQTIKKGKMPKGNAKQSKTDEKARYIN